MTMGAMQNQEIIANQEATLDALLSDLEMMSDDNATPPVEEIIEDGAPEIRATSVTEIVEEDTDPVDYAPVEENAATPTEKPAKKSGKKTSSKKKTETATGDKKKAAGEDKPKAQRKFYASKVERIKDKLGDKLGEYTVLELSDATLEGEALAKKQQETIDAIKNAGKKVQNRITFVMEFIAGKSSKLNGVITTALKVLKRDGKVSVGVEGNLYKALIEHPYSPAAAKAMGGNTLLALKTLKVIVPGEKGEYVANPKSLVLAKLEAMGVTAAS
jgi:hypothetical protein